MVILTMIVVVTMTVFFFRRQVPQDWDDRSDNGNVHDGDTNNADSNNRNDKCSLRQLMSLSERGTIMTTKTTL